VQIKQRKIQTLVSVYSTLLGLGQCIYLQIRYFGADTLRFYNIAIRYCNVLWFVFNTRLWGKVQSYTYTDCTLCV